ncbi:MAG: GNAT family N-acetyltransferase [Longispora sp.]|nr:GNAT family N-acetyltransferase [Longispora sp. (in: high G+C Gram-positive bacteria)]
MAASQLPADVPLIPVTLRHVAGILALQNALFGADGWSEWMLRSSLRSGHYYRAASADGILVGYAGLSLPRSGAPGRGASGAVEPGITDAWVQCIGVHPGYQRQGIGTMLLENLLHRAGDQYMIGLEVAVDNPAQWLYARYGFEFATIRRNYYQPSGKDAFVMKRPARNLASVPQAS